MHVCTVYIYTILKYLYNNEWLIEIILYHCHFWFSYVICNDSQHSHVSSVSNCFVLTLIFFSKKLPSNYVWFLNESFF